MEFAAAAVVAVFVPVSLLVLIVAGAFAAFPVGVLAEAVLAIAPVLAAGFLATADFLADVDATCGFVLAVFEAKVGFSCVF